MSKEPTLTPAPDEAAARELGEVVRDFAEAITEPNIGRVERVSRARSAAEAARNISDAVRLLSPYGTARESRLRDELLTGLDEYKNRPERREAGDRLTMERVSRAMNAAGSYGLHQPGTLAAAAPVNPLGGVRILPPRLTDEHVVPFLSEYAEKGAQVQAAGVDIQPQVRDDLTDVAGPPPLTPTPVTIDPENVEWIASYINFEPSRQVVDWPEYAQIVEDVVRSATLIGLERRLLASLAGTAAAFTDFEAAETAVGAAWIGGHGADLVLTNGADLPKVRRMYAAEGLTDPELRPRILATAGAPTGTAYVLATGALNLRITDVTYYAKPVVSSFSLDMTIGLDGSASLRQPGTFAAVTLP